MARDEEAEKREQRAGGGGARGESGDASRTPGPSAADDDATCEVCGVPALVWRKCKLVCENCGSVNKSCADL